MCHHLAVLPQLLEGSVSHCCQAIPEHSSSGLDASLSRCSRSDGRPSCPGCPCSAACLICQSLLMPNFHCLHCRAETRAERASCASEGLDHVVSAPDAWCSITPCSWLALWHLLAPTWRRCWVHVQGGGRGCLSLLVPRGLTLFQNHCLGPDHGPKQSFWWSPRSPNQRMGPSSRPWV